MNSEIKSILAELGIIYDFYQDKFSLQRIKKYILSMPEGSRIIEVEPGDVTLYDHKVVLPIAKFNDESDSVGLLQVMHSVILDREESDIAADSKRVSELINRLIKLISPKEN
jgi:hypothetical protein